MAAEGGGGSAAAATPSTILLVFDSSILRRFYTKDRVPEEGKNFLISLQKNGIKFILFLVSSYEKVNSATVSEYITNFFKKEILYKEKIPFAYNLNVKELYTKQTINDLYAQYASDMGLSAGGNIPYPVYFFDRFGSNVRLMKATVTGAFHIKESGDWNQVLNDIQRGLYGEGEAVPLGAGAASLGGGAQPSSLNLSGSATAGTSNNLTPFTKFMREANQIMAEAAKQRQSGRTGGRRRRTLRKSRKSRKSRKTRGKK